MWDITGHTFDRAAEELRLFKLQHPDVEVHTVTIIVTDGTPLLTIVGTDDELQDVTQADIRL